MEEFKISADFQTPSVVAEEMARILGSYSGVVTVLEPTPGLGGLVKVLDSRYDVEFPDGDFWDFCGSEPDETFYLYDAVVMNPPFNPVKECERFVEVSLELADKVIALLPWSYVVNSERRLQLFMAFGLVSVTVLPRKTFPGARVQTAIFELHAGHKGPTEFKTFTW
jgi:hypothetical protein